MFHLQCFCYSRKQEDNNRIGIFKSHRKPATQRHLILVQTANSLVLLSFACYNPLFFTHIPSPLLIVIPVNNISEVSVMGNLLAHLEHSLGTRSFSQKEFLLINSKKVVKVCQTTFLR